MSDTIKKDCFAYRSDAKNGCSCLNQLYCRDSAKCSFYKTDKDILANIVKSRKKPLNKTIKDFERTSKNETDWRG